VKRCSASDGPQGVIGVYRQAETTLRDRQAAGCRAGAERPAASGNVGSSAAAPQSYRPSIRWGAGRPRVGAGGPLAS
jgi:hypothetical protein